MRSLWMKGGQEGPPQLDELFAEFHKKFFGSSAKPIKPSQPGSGWGFVLGIILMLWVFSGIVLVSPAERAVVLRLGEYNRVLMPGPHWVPRLFESVQAVNVQRISTFSYQADMLTQDENIVFVSISVQYRVLDAKDYLYNVVDPENSIHQVTASALRQVVGHTTLDNILTKGRAEARERIEQQMKRVLEAYNTGLEVVDVNLQPAKPPEQVTEAFDDAIKAREDEQRFINQAKAYSEQVIPRAQGQAARVTQEATAKKQQLVLEAQADVAKFNALVSEYKRAPAVMKRRIYLDSLSGVFADVPKVFADKTTARALMMLPAPGAAKAGHAAQTETLSAQAQRDEKVWRAIRQELDTAYAGGGYARETA